MNLIYKILPIILLSTPGFAAITGYQISPNQIQSGTSRIIQLLEQHDDGPSIDVTSQYNFLAGSSQVIVTTMNSDPVVTGAMAGVQSIKATKKIDSTALSGLSVSINAGPANRLKYFSGASQVGEVGTPLSQQLIVQVVDLAGNPVSNIKVNFSVTSGSADFSGQPTSSINTDVNGKSSVSLNLGLIWGSVQVRAQTDVALPSTISSYLFLENSKPQTGAAASLMFVDSPSVNQIKNREFTTSATVQILDKNGLPVSVQKAVSIFVYKNSSCTTPALGLLSGSPSAQTNTGGLAIFSGLSYSQEGSIFFKASSSGLSSACSRVISVTEPFGVASKLAIISSPPAAIQNAPMFPQFQVEVRDTSNRLVTSSSDSVSLDVFSDNQCSVYAAGAMDQVASAVGGKAYFPKFAYMGAGNVYVRASSGAMQTACSLTIAVAQDPSLIITSLKYIDQNAAVQTTNIMLQIPPQVQLVNMFGQVVSGGSYPISISAYSDSGCVIPSPNFKVDTITKNSLNGYATFNNGYFNQAGTYYLKTFSGTASACSLGINVTDPGTNQVASIAWGSAPQSQAVAGFPFSPALVVVLKDKSGNPVTNVNVPLEIKAYQDSSCMIPAAEDNRKTGFAMGGAWTISGYKFTKVASVYIKISGSRLVPLCSNQVTISPSSAYKVEIVSGNNQEAEVRKQLRNPIIAKVSDQFNNVIPNFDVQFSVSGGGYSLPQSTLKTGTDGQVQSVIVLGGSVGSQTIQVGSSSITGPNKFVTFSANAKVSGDSGGIIQIGENVQIQGSVAVLSESLGGARQASGDGNILIDVGDSNTINIQGQ